MAGRKPKPNHLKLITGNPGKRKLNGRAPTPIAVTTQFALAPAWMTAKAKAAWPRVVGLLVHMGVATVSDELALEVLCEAYADWRSARDSLDQPVMLKVGDKLIELAAAGEQTYITNGQSGPMIRTRPELAIIADAERRLKTSLSDFGLTPASRTKLQAGDGKDHQEDPEEAFFR